MKKRAIGFIDSGVGGLTVVKEALKQLPNESIFYVGDSARCPYGERPAEEVIAYTWQMVNFLLQQDIKLLVIACNTATAVALNFVKNRVSIPVVGVIDPGSRAAIKLTKNNQIGVIGTPVTIASDVYRQTLRNKSQALSVRNLACPTFVPLVERNHLSSPAAYEEVARVLQPLQQSDVDTVVLGCTHYPLLKPIIQRVMGDAVSLVDSGAETITDVSALLDYFNIAELSEDTKPTAYRIYTTGDVARFSEIAHAWLPDISFAVEQITL